MAAGVSAVAAPGIAALFRDIPRVELGVTRDQSLWSSTAPSIPNYPPLQTSVDVDVAIIGGGYTGLSCAYYLKKLRPDLAVAVVETHELGSGASSRNSGAVSVSSPGVSDVGFSERGFQRFRNFIESENIDCDLKSARTLVTLNSEIEVAQARAVLMRDERLLGRFELSEGIGTSHYFGAIEKQGYSTIQPAKLMHGLAKAAVNAGVTIFEKTPALSIHYCKRPRIQTPLGSLVSRHVVVATNAYTPRLSVVRHLVFPIHHYTVATRQLANAELQKLGLDRWRLRFDNKLIGCTFGLTPNAHFFMRLPLNYASANTEVWPDLSRANTLAVSACRQQYPSLEDVPFDHGWHGITGHTIALKPVIRTLGYGNVHVTVALNGLGIMPGHNFGYLTACKIAGERDRDIALMDAASTSIPFPTEFYRNLILKPAISALNGYY